MFEIPQYDLSILIPARNEQFLARTVQDILEKIEGNTEVIVGLDGQWAFPTIKDDLRVRILYYPQSIGQRAMTNQLCRLSKAKYIIKCDAHCSFDKGFDIKMMAEMKDDWTMAPTMRNLHAFNWKCKNNHIRYQGPSGPCMECKEETVKDVLWFAKPSPQSNSFTFDETLHFQYFRDYDKRPDTDKEISESMSLQGSFFMMTREKYWELNICDERHGSWGQQGVEVALKTWLSGGKVMINKKTWYAHMFRTQGGDFSFPYPQSGRQVEKARAYSRDLWFNNKFEKQIYPLSWLIDRFKPLTYWHSDTGKETLDKVNEAGKQFYLNKKQSKGIIYYTDNRLNLKIAKLVRKQLNKIKLPIISSSLKPIDFGETNIWIKEKPGYLTMFKQIIACLESSHSDIIFFCEHDVLYHPSHFDFIPPKKDKFYYNQNWWKIWPDGFTAHWDANQVSGLCSYKENVLQYYKDRLKEIEKDGFNRSYEPGGRNSDLQETWNSEFPNIDIRHDSNLTRSHRSLEDFRDKSTGKNWQESSIGFIKGWDLKQLENMFIK